MECKFQVGQLIRHKNGGDYRIIKIPDGRRLEHCCKPFYEYECVETGAVWVRSNSEVEDSRFSPSRQADSPEIPIILTDWNTLPREFVMDGLTYSTLFLVAQHNAMQKALARSEKINGPTGQLSGNSG